MTNGYGPERTPLTTEEFDGLYSTINNAGRWGADDQLGTLNYFGPENRVSAAKLVTTGRIVSMAHDWDTVAGPDNPRPALHYMIQVQEKEHPETLGSWNGDFLGADYHGRAMTHIDALCHYEYRGVLYNGIPQSSVSSRGAEFGSVLAAKDGIVGRGVLLDVPRYRGVDWLEPGEAVLGPELKSVARAQNIELRRADICLVRTGHSLRRTSLGAWAPFNLSAGLHPTAMPWLHEAEIGVLGADSDNDVRPSSVSNMSDPVHVLALNAMGMLVLDNLQLDDVAEVCFELKRWEFLCVISPMRIPGGTGSPINPVAIF